jgi:Tellurite resistance protein TehB
VRHVSTEGGASPARERVRVSLSRGCEYRPGVSDAADSTPSVWPAYFDGLSGRVPRPLFVAALERFGPSPRTARQAIDLGAGDGTETEALLRDGWTVLAIDGEPDSKQRLEQRISSGLRRDLLIETIPFEELETLPPADFVYSGLSLPFCRPEAFPRLWSVVTSCITRGGRIACDLFGEHDTWAVRPHMTFFTRAEAEQLFEGFEIEHFDEVNEDGEAFSGPKHWHVFSVIAWRAIPKSESPG